MFKKDNLENPVQLNPGTIGGFIHMDNKIFCITAAHCLKEPIHANVLSVLEPKFDVSLIQLADATHDNLICSTMENSVHDTFEDWNEIFGGIPDPILFEPGTEIIKVGAATGITRGYLESHCINLEEKDRLGTTILWENMIRIAWLPHQRFSAGGDSGSIYFACRGCAFIPIAVHRGVNDVVKTGTHNTPVYSYGTPLNTALQILRNNYLAERAHNSELEETETATTFTFCFSRHCN